MSGSVSDEGKGWRCSETAFSSFVQLYAKLDHAVWFLWSRLILHHILKKSEKITPIMAMAMCTMNAKDILKMFEESSIVNKISMRGTNKVSAESHWWRWRRGGGGFACVFTQGTAPTCALHHVSMSTCVLKKNTPPRPIWIRTVCKKIIPNQTVNRLVHDME